MLWVHGVSRFDIAVVLRILERKIARVDSGLYIYVPDEEDDPLDALGDMTPCYATADDMRCERNRLANFQVRIADDQQWADDDEYEATLLHELVHVADVERHGVQSSSGVWSRKHTDSEGGLDRADSITYYRIFPDERRAKQAEIAHVLQPANRDYWRGILAGSVSG